MVFYQIQLRKSNNGYGADFLLSEGGGGGGYLGKNVPETSKRIIEMIEQEGQIPISIEPHNGRYLSENDELSEGERDKFRTVLKRDLGDKFPNVTLNL